MFRMLQILQEEEDRPEDEYEEMKDQTDFFFSISNTAYRNSTMSENSNYFCLWVYSITSE